ERDVVSSADVPPELVREIRLADAQYDRTLTRLSELSPEKDDAAIQELLGVLREVRTRQEDIASRVRKASPHYASVRYPEPLQLAGVRSSLDPGTALLSYSVGADKPVVLVTRAGGARGSGVVAFPLPIGEKALREKVEAFRRAVQLPNASQAALTAQGAELYELLIRPAEAQVGASQRLLLCLDGP